MTHLINTKENAEGYDVLRISADSNGNSRYVVSWFAFGKTYDEALKRAKRFGGKKHGSEIVFQSSVGVDEIAYFIRQVRTTPTTIQQIREAVVAGKQVNWNPRYSYVVVKHMGSAFIKCTSNGHLSPLEDGYDPSEFTIWEDA